MMLGEDVLWIMFSLRYPSNYHPDGMAGCRWGLEKRQMFALPASFVRKNGAKRSGKPERNFERKATTGEISTRKLSFILYILCY